MASLHKLCGIVAAVLWYFYGEVMFAFLLNMLIIALVMWAFFKFMYPKPPKHFMPQEGDDTTERNCSYCGHSLATYRGVLRDENTPNERFFCNYEHEAAFDAEKSTDKTDKVDKADK